MNAAEEEGWYDGFNYIGFSDETFAKHLMPPGSGWTPELARWVAENYDPDDIVRVLMASDPMKEAGAILKDMIADSGRVFEFCDAVYEYRLEGDDLDTEVME